jgi:NAD(P)-dependent dehydrogenase (short-subunit alcohol dehydrogenase family)
LIISNLSNLVVLISGAASGIGRATARKLARGGATIYVGDIDAASGRTLASELGGAERFVELDVTSEAAWENTIGVLIAKHARIDGLVNSAGINPVGSIVDTTYEDWRRTFAVNVDGMFLGCKHAVRAMIATGSKGSIVNVASPQAVRVAASLVAYGASKAAALNLTKSVALYAAEHGIRCNAVLPGAVRTPMVERYLQTITDYDEGLRQVAAMHPMNRLCEADEVASAIEFLLTNDASFVTGVALPVDGGYLAA